MLILPIKKKWYDMILSGEKKEEYREIKPYYTKRLQNIHLLSRNLIPHVWDEKLCSATDILPIAHHSKQKFLFQSAQEKKNGEQKKV